MKIRAPAVKLRFLGLLMAGLCASCHGEQSGSRFAILIEARARDVPVDGLIVLDVVGRRELGRTDRSGRVLLSTMGREGDEVDFLVHPPSKMMLAGDQGQRRRVLLKHMGALGSQPVGIDIVRHEVQLRRQKVPYAVLLSAAAAPGVPVLLAGTEVARLNSRGVGMFSYEGLPGEEFTVTLGTAAEPRLWPRDPEHTFILPETSELLPWDARLLVRQRARQAPQHVHPPRRGPTPI